MSAGPVSDVPTHLVDVPTHLITAAVNAYRAAQQAESKSVAASMTRVTAAVLAALRPEDAHLLPEPYSVTTARFTEVLHERDEARAEVETLQAARRQDGRFITENAYKINQLRQERDEAHAEAERLKAQVAEYENCITWGTTCKGCTTVLDRLYKTETENEHETDRLKAEVESLKANTKILESSLAAVTEACRKQRAKSRGESLVAADYRIALEHEVAQLKAENERLKEEHRNCVRPASLADVQADIYRRDPDARQRATDKAAETDG